MGPEAASEVNQAGQEAQFKEGLFRETLTKLKKPVRGTLLSDMYKFGQPLLQGGLNERTENGLLAWGAHGIPIEALRIRGNKKTIRILAL